MKNIPPQQLRFEAPDESHSAELQQPKQLSPSQENRDSVHIPVLLEDVVRLLNPHEGETYLDLTAGQRRGERWGARPAPELIRFGAEDRVVPPGNAPRLAARMPDAQVEILPHAGHFFPFETPEAANAAVVGFLG